MNDNSQLHSEVQTTVVYVCVWIYYRISEAKKRTTQSNLNHNIMENKGSHQKKARNKRSKKVTFKAQKIRALKRARDNPEESSAMGNRFPQKKFFRSRAHCNPLSHNNAVAYPKCPESMNWGTVFSSWEATKNSVSFVDVGCGFGGLTVALGREFPNEFVVGLEIRPKVSEYVRRRIQTLRTKNTHGKLYENTGILLTNAMKYLPNYFHKSQLSKMFFCFADPHFKRKNHRRRIVSEGLLHIYGYLLRPGGILYTITDVKELHLWMEKHCNKHPCFESIKWSKEEFDDICVKLMTFETEESKKVDREGRNKYIGVYRRVGDNQATTPGFSRIY